MYIFEKLFTIKPDRAIKGAYQNSMEKTTSGRDSFSISDKWDWDYIFFPLIQKYENNK